jgi:GntR family transcriptional regulator, transcriptional repressor for pyruvate dehydrogenase complex
MSFDVLLCLFYNWIIGNTFDMEDIMNTLNNNEFGIVKRSSSLSDQIAEKLLFMIRDRKLKPGDMLPPERELAEMMGVSRPTLRGALGALSIMNIIENRQGSGTYVTSLEPEQVIEHLDVIFSINDHTIVELFEARRVIEVGLTGIAAIKVDEEKSIMLLSLCEKSKDLIHDVEAFMQCDLDLHETIMDIADNSFLSLFMKSINKLNLYSRRRTNEFLHIREMAVQAHCEIVNAIIAHDVEKAKLAMQKHLELVEAEFRKQ